LGSVYSFLIGLFKNSSQKDESILEMDPMNFHLRSICSN
jgi:hypothetical protein